MREVQIKDPGKEPPDIGADPGKLYLAISDEGMFFLLRRIDIDGFGILHKEIYKWINLDRPSDKPHSVIGFIQRFEDCLSLALSYLGWKVLEFDSLDEMISKWDEVKRIRGTR